MIIILKQPIAKLFYILKYIIICMTEEQSGQEIIKNISGQQYKYRVIYDPKLKKTVHLYLGKVMPDGTVRAPHTTKASIKNAVDEAMETDPMEQWKVWLGLKRMKRGKGTYRHSDWYNFKHGHGLINRLVKWADDWWRDMMTEAE